MSYRATGTFEVTIEPLSGADDPFGRMRIVKEFTGGLVADGLGEMLTVATEVEGSATYVALDRVTGTLDGRRGTFVLRHNGIMTRGVGELSVDVVPAPVITQSSASARNVASELSSTRYAHRPGGSHARIVSR